MTKRSTLRPVIVAFAALCFVTPVIGSPPHDATPEELRAFALWCMLSLGDDSLVGVPPQVREAAMHLGLGRQRVEQRL